MSTPAATSRRKASTPAASRGRSASAIRSINAKSSKPYVAQGRGVATSGSYVRGQHIYDPFRPAQRLDDIVSLTVVGADVLEADRFATAAFAMGRAGIYFIDERRDLEGYAIDAAGVATKTSGFERYAT